MIVLVQERPQAGVALRRTDLRVARVDVDVDRRPAAPPLEGDTVHAGDVDQEVRLAEQRRRASRRRPVLDAASAVHERPAIAEPHAAEEVRRDAEAVLVRRPELARRRVVGGGPERGLLVEPDVVPERAAAEEVVRRLPRVAAEGWRTR
jgi:hypothetical protein